MDTRWKAGGILTARAREDQFAFTFSQLEESCRQCAQTTRASVGKVCVKQGRCVKLQRPSVGRRIAARHIPAPRTSGVDVCPHRSRTVSLLPLHLLVCHAGLIERFATRVATFIILESSDGLPGAYAVRGEVHPHTLANVCVRRSLSCVAEDGPVLHLEWNKLLTSTPTPAFAGSVYFLLS